jgi:hypothetical protein
VTAIRPLDDVGERRGLSTGIGQPTTPEAVREGGRMLALHCPRHGHRVLLDLDRIRRVTNLGEGIILIEARCYDGQPIIEISGSAATLPPDQVGRRPVAARPVTRWARPADVP